MSRLAVLLPALLLLAVLPAFAGEDAPAQDRAYPENMLVETLDNGLQVVIEERHSVPIVRVHAYMKIGSLYEGEYLGSGLSHYMEHIVSGGSTRREVVDASGEETWVGRTEDENKELLKSIGGNSNASTSLQLHAVLHHHEERDGRDGHRPDLGLPGELPVRRGRGRARAARRAAGAAPQPGQRESRARAALLGDDVQGASGARAGHRLPVLHPGHHPRRHAPLLQEALHAAELRGVDRRRRRPLRDAREGQGVLRRLEAQEPRALPDPGGARADRDCAGSRRSTAPRRPASSRWACPRSR